MTFCICANCVVEKKVQEIQMRKYFRLKAELEAMIS
jgi:hypothetical protein